MEFPVLSVASTLSLVQNSIFSDTRLHWYTDNPFANSLQSNRTCRNIFNIDLLRMRFMYIILRSISKMDVISGCSNTPTIRSCITMIIGGNSWSNVSMKGELLLKRFCLDAVRIDFWMKRISASSTSSVLSLYYISYKGIAGSIPRVLSPGGGFLLGLAVEALTSFILMVLSIFFKFFNTNRLTSKFFQ